GYDVPRHPYYFAAPRRKLSPILLTGHLRRMALLHDRRQHSIFLPPPRAQCSTNLSGVRLSLLSRAFRVRLSAPSLLHVHQQPTVFGGGLRGHSGGSANLLLFQNETP